MLPSVVPPTSFVTTGFVLLLSRLKNNRLFRDMYWEACVFQKVFDWFCGTGRKFSFHLPRFPFEREISAFMFLPRFYARTTCLRINPTAYPSSDLRTLKETQHQHPSGSKTSRKTRLRVPLTIKRARTKAGRCFRTCSRLLYSSWKMTNGTSTSSRKFWNCRRFHGPLFGDYNLLGYSDPKVGILDICTCIQFCYKSARIRPLCVLTNAFSYFRFSFLTYGHERGSHIWSHCLIGDSAPSCDLDIGPRDPTGVLWFLHVQIFIRSQSTARLFYHTGISPTCS